jgi:hypothetical protein
MNKISDWLKTLPDGHREICLANFERSGNKDEEVKTLHQAIDLGCNWQDPENNFQWFSKLCNWAWYPPSGMLPELPKKSFTERIKALLK